jgi:hypothetical protein
MNEAPSRRDDQRAQVPQGRSTSPSPAGTILTQPRASPSERNERGRSPGCDTYPSPQATLVAALSNATMPQSLAQIYLHLVFSTKDRKPWLRDAALRDELYAYMAALFFQGDRSFCSGEKAATIKNL